MFSEEYFMYAEDIDLNFKAAAAGYKNYFIPDAVIIHYGGGSSSRQSVNQWATKMQQRAMSQYYTKTRGRWYVACYRVAMGVSALARLSFLALAKPFGRAAWDTQSRRAATDKWRAILQWAVGQDTSAIGGR
jgi:GT2 family glycosyltransferase